jgi:hypothetical protein
MNIFIPNQFLLESIPFGRYELLEGKLTLEENQTLINEHIFKQAEYITDIFPETFDYWLKFIQCHLRLFVITKIQ